MFREKYLIAERWGEEHDPVGRKRKKADPVSRPIGIHSVVLAIGIFARAMSKHAQEVSVDDAMAVCSV